MKSVWGIDIGRSSFKAVKLQVNQDNIQVVDFDIIEYAASSSKDDVASEQEFHLALNTFRSRHKIKGETIVVSPSFHSVFNRFVNLPAVSGDRLQEVVKYEAQQHIPFAIEEVVWSYQKSERVYQPGEEIEVVFFAVKRELVDQFVKLLNSSNLNIDIIQFAPVALYNYVMFDYASLNTGKNFVILDVGANNTSLILVEGNRFWIRNLPIVGSDITKAIHQKLGISFAEAEKLKISTISKESPEAAKIFSAIQNILKDLASEIHRSIGFYKSLASGRSANFDKIVLVGNASKTIYFEEFVSQRLQLATFKFEGLNNIEFSENVDKVEFTNKLGGLGVALGLALQGLDKTPNKINLLPPEIIQSRVTTRRQPFFVAIPVVIFLIAIFIHFIVGERLDLVTGVNENIKVVLDERADIREGYTKLENIDDKTKQLEDLASVVKQRDIWMWILNNLNDLDIFSDPNIAPDKGRIEIFNGVPNKTDLQVVHQKELEKIWLLDIKIKKNKAEGAGEFINLEMICGIVARQRLDGDFDPVASHKFVIDNLVDPLTSKFGITDVSPLALDNQPISDLRTDSENKEIPPFLELPKYYRFSVKIQIPINK